MTTYYPISNDRGIQAMFKILSTKAQDAILRRDEIEAMKTNEIGIKEYLHLISNPREGFLI